MKWMKVTIDTLTDAVDIISSMLSDLGIEGIEIEDNVPLTEEEKCRMFIDFIPKPRENDNKARINLYIDPQDDIDSLIKKINDGLKEISEFIDIGNGKYP